MRLLLTWKHGRLGDVADVVKSPCINYRVMGSLFMVLTMQILSKFELRFTLLEACGAHTKHTTALLQTDYTELTHISQNTPSPLTSCLVQSSPSSRAGNPESCFSSKASIPASNLLV